ncbi:glycosyl hydrolase family 99 protein [Nitzschia inconspicua]|uniref:Glycosyl hydrolase family 99 protein n=1 Tax=Nitzschia inconspicua TaxID=303405 RepID=A0A9K3LAR5_9STRA|nr:glycosyl hydrolase family 99 protein [Nitzschia inconspicua]
MTKGQKAVTEKYFILPLVLVFVLSIFATIFVLGTHPFRTQPTVFDEEWNGQSHHRLLQNYSSGASKNKLNVTTGAYYYPWHGEDFHNGEGFLRAVLKPRQGPELGEYDDTKKKTIKWHLEFSDMANLDLWVTSWWGPEQITDTTTRDTIMKQVEKEGHPLKIALLYESTNRLRVNREWVLDEDRIKADMKYLTKEYFDHFDNYLRIDGKPVMFIYLTRVLQREGGDHEAGQTLLQKTIALMRKEAKQEIFIVGDHAFDSYPEDVMSSTAALHNSSLQILDGITNYDIYGWMIGQRSSSYPGVDRLNRYYFWHQARWKQIAAEHNCVYIPSVMPGFNDRGVRDSGKVPLSRRLTPTSREGSFFEASLKRALQLVDEKADNLLVVTSFNEWHEDTMIEPVRTQDQTTQPESMTDGLAYSGYGTLYLDLLRNYTRDFEEDPMRWSKMMSDYEFE